MALTPDQQKRAVAAAALAWTEPRLERDLIIGIGTGSTADHFIDLLATHRDRFTGAVASSSRSAHRLEAAGIRVFDLDAVGELPFYIDGADEINDRFQMVKGGGGALTREKIVAASSTIFVCICDASKRVDALGRFALPLEVIPMARSHVIRSVERLSAEAALGPPECRVRTDVAGAPYVTDNGNWIVDIGGWVITDPPAIEASIGAIVGVVESGLFALRAADILLISGSDGVETRMRRP